MLDYLVTSRARRALLRVLWTRRERGSVSELARRAGVSFRSAHRELQAMHRAGLVRLTRAGNSTTFEADSNHPGARTLEALLEAAATPTPREEALALRTNADVRAALAAWGAPVEASPLQGDPPPLEETLVSGARLSRLDGSVARSLPVSVWKNRDRFDFERLLEEARRAGERHTVGFFLSLTGTLSGDRKLKTMARRFRDRRVLKAQDFFTARQSSFARELARRRTPAVAKAWKFTMNMSLDTFASTFRKFVIDAEVPLQ